MTLAYKSWHPVKIFRDRRVLTSVLDGRDRGLSMTTNLSESGHGPFMIVFRPDRPWYAQFLRCEYGVRPADRRNVPAQVYKNECFRCEAEWWSPTAVEFVEQDVEKVVFMSDSPATRIHPRKTAREWKQFLAEFPDVRAEVDARRHPLE